MKPVLHGTCMRIFTIFFSSIVLSVSSLLNKLKSQAREQMETRRPNLVKALQKMGDFYMELKWDFQSWGRSYDY